LYVRIFNKSSSSGSGNYNDYSNINNKGCAMAQAVSHWLLNTEARIELWGQPMWYL